MTVGSTRKYVNLSILYNLKAKGQHVSIIESRINVVKRRLFHLIRAKKTYDWRQYLQQTVTNLNKTPCAALGGLIPYDVPGINGDR